MTVRTPTIAALGGGGFSMEPDNDALDRWLLSLTAVSNPRVLFIPTASGDSDTYVAKFFTAFTRHTCRPSVLPLFRRTGDELSRAVLGTDLVFVGGGNTANMLAIWREHRLVPILRDAWERGVVLSGISAGAICWFEQGSTDSFGPAPKPLNCLGFLPGSFCPHYDGEAQRRPTYQRMVVEGELQPGIAADDGCAVLYRGIEVAEVVASRPGPSAWLITTGSGGTLSEKPIEARVLT
mgnify:CR=1 FL=1